MAREGQVTEEAAVMAVVMVVEAVEEVEREVETLAEGRPC